MSRREEVKRIPQGRFARMTRVAGLGAGLATELFSVAGRYAVGSDRDKAARRFHEQTAERLVKTFGTMKGLPMKLGQMVSYLEEFIPLGHRDIYRKALTRLQSEALPIRWREIESILKEDLGAGPDELFSEFNQDPVAAASIGQVYRARLKSGEEVAVKVQYPGIAEAIRNDLKNVEIIRSALSMILSKVDVDQTLKDVTDRMLEECDYGCELCSHEEFWSAWKDDEKAVVPRIYGEFSAERVLTTQWIEGCSLDELCEKPLTQEQRNAYGETLFRVAFASLYGHGLVNADPHPGNYLFLDDGKVGFIDFGCVQRYDRQAIEDLARIRNLIGSGATGKALHPAMKVAFGLPDDLDDEEWSFMEEYCHHAYLPVLSKEPLKIDKAYNEKLADLAMKGSFLGVRKAIRKGVKEAKRPGLVFLTRLHVGLMAMLAQLGAEADWTTIMAGVDAEHGLTDLI